ncbi:MAG: flavin reductase family protein [Bdellovibrionota bacterium]
MKIRKAKAHQKKSLALGEVYRFIEPGPGVLLATSYKRKYNVMTMSWHTMLDFEPPLLGCVVSNRNFSFEPLRRSRECTINIPSARLLKKVVECGNTSGRSVDKFQTCGLTPLPGTEVKAPIIEECFVNLECRIVDARMANKYNFFVLEVVRAWMDRTKAKPRTIHHLGNGVFMESGKIVKTRSKAK